MSRAPSRPRVAILGCGAVGAEFAAALLLQGRPGASLTVWSRSPTSVSALRRRLGALRRGLVRGVRVAESPLGALLDSEIALLCVSDRSVAPLARELAREAAASRTRAPVRRPVVLLANGYLSLAVLAPLAELGFVPGRLHPLVPVPRADLTRFHLRPFAVEGEGRARTAAGRLLEWMGCYALPLRGGAAPAYHASAALLGGGLIALLQLAEQGMGASVRSRRLLRTALRDFVRDVSEEAWLRGPSLALTGPLARGSEDLVAGHLHALRAVPHARQAYRVLGQVMLELAYGRGSIDAPTRRRLALVLAGVPRGRPARRRA